MWKRLNSNQMCEKCSYKEVFLIKRFLIERFYCIYLIYTYLRGGLPDSITSLHVPRELIRSL